MTFTRFEGEGIPEPLRKLGPCRIRALMLGPASTAEPIEVGLIVICEEYDGGEHMYVRPLRDSDALEEMALMLESTAKDLRRHGKEAFARRGRASR